MGDLASDKHYLEDILDRLATHTTLKTPAQTKLQTEAEGALNYLIERRDFWAQQNPDYPDIAEEDVKEKLSWKTSMLKCMKRRRHEQSALNQAWDLSGTPYG